MVVVWQAWICNYVVYRRDLHFFICGHGCIGCRQMEDGTSKVSVDCILPYLLSSSPLLCLFQHKINIYQKELPCAIIELVGTIENPMWKFHFDT